MNNFIYKCKYDIIYIYSTKHCRINNLDKTKIMCKDLQ